MKKFVAAIVCAAVLTAPVQAGGLAFEAVPQEGVTSVRWLGAPKLIQQRQRGRVTVAPRGIEKGRLAFDVEVHNLGEGAAVFGPENVEVHAADETLSLDSRARMEQRAKSKAKWTRIGVTVALVALVGVAAFATRSNAPHHSHYLPKPRRDPAVDVPRVTGSDPALEAALTVPARHLYSGRIFVERPKGPLKGQELSLAVSFNGESYPFAFRVSETR